MDAHRNAGGLGRSSEGSHSLSQLDQQRLEAPAAVSVDGGSGCRPLVDFRCPSNAIVKDLLAGHVDEFTCAVLHTKAVLVGTKQGCVWRLDPSGSAPSRIACLRNSQVQDLSVDTEGNYCAAAASDGSVAVLNLTSGGSSSSSASPASSASNSPGNTSSQGTDPWVFEHGSCPVLSVAICPSYSSASRDSYLACTGGQDGRLLLHRRTRFGASAVFHEGEGPVVRVSWRGPLIAWANDRGMKVFNLLSGQKVTYIAKPDKASGDTSRCHMVWASDDQLLIAWGSVVKVAYVLASPGDASSVDWASGRLTVEVRHQFSLAYPIFGLASVGRRHLIVLTCPGPLALPPVGAGGPEVAGGAAVHLCDCNGDVFHVAEVPGLRHLSEVRGPVALSAVASHLPMLLAGPRELTLMTVRDFLEHAVQLLELGLFDEAIRLANGGGDGAEGLRHLICLKCIVPDLKLKRFDQACATIGRFRGLEAPTWLELATLFDSFGGLSNLAGNDVIPVPPRGEQLPREVYDEVLQRLVDCPSALVAVLHWWSPEIFSAAALRERLRGRLPAGLDVESTTSSAAREGGASLQLSADELSEKDRHRAEALALLEAATGDVPAAAQLLLALGSSQVFSLLRQYPPNAKSRPEEEAASVAQLWDVAQASSRRLFEIDDCEACSLLVEQRATVPVKVVVEALLGSNNRWRHEYLKKLFDEDEKVGRSYHAQMVRLFAEYEPWGLLKFLEAIVDAPLEEPDPMVGDSNLESLQGRVEFLEYAVDVCGERGLLEEQAFLLGRQGKTSEALGILLEKMGDVRKAIHFASEYHDHKLWEQLVNFVLKENPQLLVSLLERLEALSIASEVGKDCGRPRPPPTATPEHVLRNLPLDTSVPKVAPSIRRIIASYELSASLYVSCNKLSLEETQRRWRQTVERRSRGCIARNADWRCDDCGESLAHAPKETPDWSHTMADDSQSTSSSSHAFPSGSLSTSPQVNGLADASASGAAAENAALQQQQLQQSKLLRPGERRISRRRWALPPARGAWRIPPPSASASRLRPEASPSAGIVLVGRRGVHKYCHERATMQQRANAAEGEQLKRERARSSSALA
eukprot:TRINITY_DN43230_c0_g1_i1.p1 TRINITY_DN43230_c0_g1~~TRINITY_DN43230_c0_g1_i1.p1  ORF type:complete len:1091 (+),score=242.61 TRINITY_DN43230_c0_g1_i1:106-3378(+)